MYSSHGDILPTLLFPAKEYDCRPLSPHTGAPPTAAARFISWLRSSSISHTVASRTEENIILAGKPFAVLGLGSRTYPRFCASADLFEGLLQDCGAGPMVLPTARADSNSDDEAVAVWGWVSQLLKDAGCDPGWASSPDAVAESAVAAIPVKKLDEMVRFS